MIGLLLFCVIELSGIAADDLHVRAFFDAHNVKVGDPMTLTVDFLGTADFGALHPPALAGTVAASDWKLDDASAKTETLESGQTVFGRRITYRVRPRRAGVLEFPALEFAYGSDPSSRRMTATRAMPVHVKAGRQVVVAELGEDPTQMPMPAALITDCPPGWNGDLEFAWRKACANPTTAAFAAFDGPEARLNEARCAILDGNWARALSIYRMLEWRIGQTPALEQGMIAALARKYDNPAAELPVWRQVGRPVLRYAWAGRLGIGLGVFALVAGFFWLINRGVRAVAALALGLLLVLPSSAETTVKETVTTNADGSVTRRVIRTSSGGNGSMSYSFTSSSSSSAGSMPKGLAEMQAMFDDDFFGSGRQNPPVRIEATVHAERDSAMVGEDFQLILALEMPKRCRFAEGLSFSLSERPGLALNGRPRLLDERDSDNPTNCIRRYGFTYRSLQPISEPLQYAVSGDIITGNGGFGFFRRTTPYRQSGTVKNFQVRELPQEGRPEDFFGIVADELVISERTDLAKVETNDVVTVTYQVRAKGYIPRGEPPKDVAYEWQRSAQDDVVEYRRYVVADGRVTTPEFSLSYYSPSRQCFLRAKTSPQKLNY